MLYFEEKKDICITDEHKHYNHIAESNVKGCFTVFRTENVTVQMYTIDRE